ncbi:MAG: class I SAM-dependent methyltransferase [Synechococcaceae cyanobacterium]|nr:class I SAM-dependent methyltransferase [Synechococcaceae cyanobacterium]
MLSRKLRTVHALLTNPDQAKLYLVNHGRHLLILLGFEFYWTDRFFRGNDDRRILETQILPWYASRDEFRTIVFTGGQWYTMGYRKLFKGRRYIVMEISKPCARRYGGPGAIAASCAESEQYFQPGELDLVLFTGVFGYGLNTRAELDKALLGFYRCLRPGGEMLFSWDDLPKYTPFDPLTSPIFQKFERIVCPVLNTDRITTTDSWRKTWIFLRKPQTTLPASPSAATAGN